MRPPKTNQKKATWVRLWKMVDIAKMHNQPMAIYMVEESQCGQVIQNILKQIPINAKVHTITSKIRPFVPVITLTQTGV